MLSQGVPLIIIFVSLLVRGEISLRVRPAFISHGLRKEIFFLSLFGILTGFSSIILTTLDKVFINRYLGENEVGIYAIATYFAVMIALPGRSVAKISIPFLAESWKNDDLDTIYDLYKRSSINQYAIGLLIFTGLVVNLDNIFRLLPEAYGNSGGVIIMVGLGYLISIIAGINGIILSTSTLYRYQTWLMFILVALFVGTSMIFIPLYGINGAALATMISNIIYNMLGVVVAGKRFGIWPFSKRHLQMTLMAAAAALAGFILPQMSLVADILLRSLLVTVVYTAGLYTWRLSDDVNTLIDLVIRRFRGGS